MMEAASWLEQQILPCGTVSLPEREVKKLTIFNLEDYAITIREPAYTSVRVNAAHSALLFTRINQATTQHEVFQRCMTQEWPDLEVRLYAHDM